MVPRGRGLYAWQRYAFDRMFETGADGSLRFRVVVVLISRQQGKSVAARGWGWWRIHEGGRWSGEPQTLVHVANKVTTAREVWRPAGLAAQARYGRAAVKWGNGSEAIDLTALPTDEGALPGGRWMVQAATDNAGVGFTLDAALIDEGWNVAESVADDALLPAMSETDSPQLLIVSTAGVEDASALIRTYRAGALAKRLDGDEDTDVLLLEWSAPPEAVWDDPATWRWASPAWSDRREAFLQSRCDKAKLTRKGEAAFRRQYLNQWTAAENPWIPPSVWALGHDTDLPDGRPDVVAVEVSPERDRYAVVAAWRTDSADSVYVRARVCYAQGDVWDRITEWSPRAVLLAPQIHLAYRGRVPAVMVGTSELDKALSSVQEAIRDGRLRHHPDDSDLTDDVARTQALTTARGLALANHARGEAIPEDGTRPIDACRAMVWAAGALLHSAARRPRIYTPTAASQ